MLLEFPIPKMTTKNGSQRKFSFSAIHSTWNAETCVLLHLLTYPS